VDAAMNGSAGRALQGIELNLLLQAIVERYHYDFRQYSRASLERRLLQAKEHFGCASFSALQHLVLHEPALFPELLDFLTVRVSEFFRDPSYFKALREEVVPHLKTYPSLKIWVAGCGQGEELYSLAILFREEGLEQRTLFYGTDINDAALQKAQTGIYDAGRVPLFTENHRRSGAKGSLSDYYTAAYGAVVFDKSLVRRAVFSNHSLVCDSVFAEVHLVCCRNVLIYFERELQERAVGVFREALVRKGFLGLGAKETLRFSVHAPAFADWVPRERIYRKSDES
jgi:chemotaxis protein methyltransferase CheR